MVNVCFPELGNSGAADRWFLLQPTFHHAIGILILKPHTSSKSILELDPGGGGIPKVAVGVTSPLRSLMVNK